MAGQNSDVPSFPGLIDLAAERVGGKVLVANDDFFAEKENLLKPGRGVFIPDKYTDRGKWMDGWETRRRRTPGNDWCVIKLGLRGIIKSVDVDTNHFLGNHPPFASIDTAILDGEFPRDEHSIENVSWKNILPQSPLNPGSQNFFDIADGNRWTHVRLNIFPDGGVARFRVYGIVVPDWSKAKPDDMIDLAAVENGGVPLVCSDMFFSSMHNLIMPGRAANMGDGWETKRRRGPGYDWIILKLGAAGTPYKIEVDTNHFKGNYPDTCSIDVCYAPDAAADALTSGAIRWTEILAKTKLQADTRHFFEKELKQCDSCTHLRLNIYPDGGVSRLRVWGRGT
ncbi:MAG: allantoicase [Ignavibacteriae bacterium]|nr:allantoicase [Ignavibacteria bacterium]MBI3363450.1 allantoicase [Ignavibacteriota bacterium]